MRSSDPSTSATTLASTTTTVLEGEVTVSRDVQYGENRSYGNDPIALRMDVFVPGRAAEGGWPLLVLLGRATPDPTNVTPGPPDPDISNPAKYGSDFATTIAERGIVVATIDIDQELRASGEGTQIPADTGVAWRTLRAIQDTNAAVRFFRGDAATSDRYGIDPERVFIGGHSVMGTLSGITTYLDEPAAWGPDMEKVAAAYGGLEGSAGSPNYDSSVSAWISLAGALPADDLHWITPDDVPMLVVYPTHDDHADEPQDHDHARLHRRVGRRHRALRPGHRRPPHPVADLRHRRRRPLLRRRPLHPRPHPPDHHLHHLPLLNPAIGHGSPDRAGVPPPLSLFP
jgi:hypothetical protein